MLTHPARSLEISDQAQFRTRPKLRSLRRHPRRRHARRLGSAFQLLWIAGGVSSIGDGMALLALTLLATSLTRDPRLIAGIAVAKGGAWLLLGLPAGSLVDRWERRHIFALSELSRALILLALGLLIASHHATILTLYVIAFALGSFEALFAGVSFAALPELVTTCDLPRANGRLGATETAGEYFAGPALGGVFFGLAASLPFIFDGVSFAVSAALLMLAFGRRPKKAIRRNRDRRPATASIRDGVAFMWNHSILRTLAVLIGAKSFCQGMWLSVLVLYGLDVLGLTSSTYGLFFAVIAIGDIAGSLIASRVCSHSRTGTVLHVTGLIAAAGYLVVGLTSNFIIAGAALIAEAVVVGVGLVASLSLRQMLIPAELMGRVGNTYRTIGFTLSPLGAVTGGIIARRAGLHSTFLLAAALQAIAMTALGPRLTRSLCEFDERASTDVQDLLMGY